MKRIVIFASGSGSNAENIIRYFSDNKNIKVVLLLSNNPDAFAIERAQKHSIPTFLFTKEELNNTLKVDLILKEYNASIIVLAGFLLKIPEYMIRKYSNAIVNIHPSLLPKYGGVNMYGMHVHQAVKENRETMSGISIHYVNQFYDEGQLLFQASVAIKSQDSAGDIAHKVQQLEYEHYPKVIKKLLFDSKMIDEK